MQRFGPKEIGPFMMNGSNIGRVLGSLPIIIFLVILAASCWAEKNAGHPLILEFHTREGIK